MKNLTVVNLSLFLSLCLPFPSLILLLSPVYIPPLSGWVKEEGRGRGVKRLPSPLVPVPSGDATSGVAFWGVLSWWPLFPLHLSPFLLSIPFIILFVSFVLFVFSAPFSPSPFSSVPFFLLC